MAIILETTRLILKQFTEDDVQHLFELNSDPDVVKYTGESVYTDMAEVEKTLLRNYDQYEKYKQGRLGIFDNKTGEYMGWCGLRYFPENNQTDLGYRLLKRYWGNGYATEASIACLNYAFGTVNLDTVIATAAKANTASIHVLEKLGFKYSHDDFCHNDPASVYMITKEEWK